MKKVTYKCDRCGAEIVGVAYTITCYAEDVNPGPGGSVSLAVAAQNTAQNTRLMTSREKHLCGGCKDEITDGIFVV